MAVRHDFVVVARRRQLRPLALGDSGQGLVDDPGGDEGGHVAATVGVRVGGDPRLVAERLAREEAIEWVVITAGSFDLLVEIVCRSEADLVAIISDTIRSDADVRETETFMHLHTEKNVFAWGRRLALAGQPQTEARPVKTEALAGQPQTEARPVKTDGRRVKPD